MQPHYNLAKFVNWAELCRELGFRGDMARALPANVPCPICRRLGTTGNSPSRSSIFHHFTLGGQWHRCTGCGHRGDSLSLAARTWGLDLAGAISRCRRLDLLPAAKATTERINNYHTGLKLEQAVRNVWTEACSGGLYQTSGQRLARLSGWRASANVDWRAHGMDRLVGCMPALRIEEMLGDTPGAPRGRSCFRQGDVVVDPTVGRIFRGSGWQSALVVPFYDLPDRLVGFHLRGRNLQMAQDQFFCCVDPERQPGHREGGVHVHPDLFDYGEELIGFSSLRWGLRLQSRHLENRPEPLPVFNWQAGPGATTNTGWQALAAKRLILWEPQPTVAALTAAIRQDADLAFCPLSDKSDMSVTVWMGTFQPEDFVGMVLERARPWPELLADLRRQEPGSFASLIESLALEEDLLERLRHDCDARTAGAVKALARKARPHRSISFQNLRIEQRRNGLYRLSKPSPGRPSKAQRIFSGLLRLEKLIWYPESKDVDYIGQLTSEGRSVEFSVDRETLKHHTQEWLEEVTLSAGLTPPQCGYMWEPRLHDLVLAFHRPEPEVGFERVGWSVDHAAFILPQWKIEYGGRHCAHRLFRRTLATPGDITPDHGARGSLLPKLLEDTKANRAFWQLYVEMLGLVLLPALDAKTQNLLLTGPVGDMAAAVASAFKSPALTVANRSPELSGLRHRWPVWLPGPIGSAGWPAADADSLVATVSWPEALSLHISDFQPERPTNRQRVLTRVGSFDPPTVADCSGLSWLLFEYLQHVCATQFAGVTRDTYVKHFWNFVGELHGAQPSFQPSGWREYGSVGGTAELLARLVGWMLAEGYTSLLPRNSKGRSNSVLWFEDELLFIPKMLVRQCLREEGCHDAPIEYLSEKLRAETNIKGEEMVSGHVCWCVSGTWLFKYANEERNKELGKAAIRLAE